MPLPGQIKAPVSGKPTFMIVFDCIESFCKPLRVRVFDKISRDLEPYPFPSPCNQRRMRASQPRASPPKPPNPAAKMKTVR